MEQQDKTALAILSQKVKPLKPLSDRLEGEAKSKFLDLDEPSKNLYSLLTCQTCKIELTIQEISESITKGAPPLCKKHQAELSQEIAKLAPLLENLKS